MLARHSLTCESRLKYLAAEGITAGGEMGERPATADSGPQSSEKREYVKPVLIAHGRLQAFTAATVSGHKAPGDAVPSDLRLKDGSKPLPDGALAQVMALRPVEFSWIDTGARQTGFIAQEVEA